MDDIISRAAAIERIDEALARVFKEPCGELILRKVPSAQPEIVRCKDCKWFNDIGCAIYIVDDSDKPTENDYCSYGERREVSE